MRDISLVNKEIEKIELQMSNGEFWNDKDSAQKVLIEYQNLKQDLGLIKKRFSGNAIISIYAGAGGDDAEDFVRMLSNMYTSYCTNIGLKFYLIDEQTTNTGYRSVSYEIISTSSCGAYGTLYKESGVHRLVRLSPFNAKHTRETSFALVDVVPVLEENNIVGLEKDDLDINFSKSGGPGGQNVNKRETAVKITHIPTGISVGSSSERSQELNKEKAMKILYSKLVLELEKKHVNSLKDLALAGKIDNEWGSQIRNYVLHPYKLVKDLRSGVESQDPDAVLSGDLGSFIVGTS